MTPAEPDAEIDLARSVGFRDEDIDRLPSELCMGDLRKLELARTLATGAELLLLGEVFAGITTGEIAQITNLLNAKRKAGITRINGTIQLVGIDLTGRKTAEIVTAGVGYSPERAHLYMSVRGNLLVGAHTARDEIERNLDLVHGLFPVLLERGTQETATQSGGERQLVSVGRALMTRRRLLLVDEPTTGLSAKVHNDIAVALKRLNDETGLTILITEENVNFAQTLASRIHVLETGHIRMSGTAEELRSDRAVAEAYFGD